MIFGKKMPSACYHIAVTAMVDHFSVFMCVDKNMQHMLLKWYAFFSQFKEDKYIHTHKCIIQKYLFDRYKRKLPPLLPDLKAIEKCKKIRFVEIPQTFELYLAPIHEKLK